MGYQDKLKPVATPSYAAKLKPIAAPVAAPAPTPIGSAGQSLAKKPGETLMGDVGQIASKVTTGFGFGKTADTIGSIVANQAATPRTKALLPMPSAGATAGAALNVGSLLTPVGAVERAGAGALARVLPKAAATVGGKVLAGGAAGAVLDAGQKLEQGKAPTPGVNAAIGAAIPLPGAAKSLLKAGAAKASENLAPRLINSLIKPLSKGFSYGKNPGRAVAQEGITANSMEELATKIGQAGTQLALVSKQQQAKYQASSQFSQNLYCNHSMMLSQKP